MTSVARELGRKRLSALLASARANRAVADVNGGAEAYQWDQARHFNLTQLEKLNAVAKKIAVSAFAAVNTIVGGKECSVTSRDVVQGFFGNIAGESEGESKFFIPLNVGAKITGFVSVSVGSAMEVLGTILNDKESGGDKERKLSPLENSIVQDMLVSIASAAGAAMKAAGGSDVKAGALSRGKINFEMDQKAQLCTVGFDIAIDEIVTKVDVNIISSDLNAVAGANSATAAMTKEQLQSAMLWHIGPVNVAVDTMLARTEVLFSQVVNLSAGDIIVFEKPIADPATVMLQGKEIFSARLGASQGRYALVVDEMITDSN